MPKVKKDKNQKEKFTLKKFGKILLRIVITLLIIVAIIAIIAVIANLISVKSSNNFISSIKTVEYKNQLKPEISEKDGYYTFTTDNESFKALQLTDVHIGAGFLSTKKDAMAINAVEAMIREEKPDLVIITGDIGYPVPFQAGTFNNKNAAKIFANLMEQMGVYWAPAFGNHDTEAYSYYTREDIAKVYSDKKTYPHCLFQNGPDNIFGVGNYIVNVKNSKDEIFRSFIMMDSNAYLDDDKLGILWHYDAIHEDQVKWYDDQINMLKEENNGVTPKSFLFFHIPIQEMKTAYDEYKNNGMKDTENAQYLFGKDGEKDAVVYASELNYGMFDKALELGSTQGMFFGHDHLNSFSMMYKGIQMTYGYSIDYLAYSGISKFGTQRGCTNILSFQDGNYTINQENYYQDKYQTSKEKEKVSMSDYYEE